MPAISKGLSRVANYDREPEHDEEARVIPLPEEWDYRTSPIGPRGEDLPAGAQAWRPDGLPHFSDGITGKLKSYWYNFTKDVPNVADVEEMTNLWRQSQATIQADKSTPYWAQDNEAAGQFRQNILDAFSGRGAPLSEEQIATRDTLAKKQKAGQELTPEEKEQLKELGKGTIDQSSLSGARRLVNVGVAAGLDLFNAAAYGTKQAIGAVRGAGEALEEVGNESALPSLVGDYDPEEAAQLSAERKTEYQMMVDSGEINPRETPPSITWQEAKNNLKATLLNTPLGIGYNLIRTALAPNNGKWDVVKDRMAEGWDSGRVLYTQVLDPMVRYEYERRLNEGENPEVLALELQNPWAEMIGEMILDPLNLIGAGAKGAKVAGKIDEGMQAGEALVKAVDPTMEANVKLWQAVGTDEGAARIVRETAESYAEATAKRIETRAQKYGWSQLTSTSQANRLKRDMANFFNTTIAGMLKDGRQADEIADIMKYGIMSVSDNVDEVTEGIAGLMNASVPKQFFSELGNDSLSTVRRMITNSDGALDANKISRALASDDPLMSITKLADEAASQRFASVQEMEKASKAVASGKFTDEQAKLAKAYDQVPEHIKLETKLLKKPEYVKNKVNTGLGFFYFTINPGTAIRNSISNKMFVTMDHGIGAAFKGVKEVTENLTKKLGYEYRVGDTFGSQAGDAPNLMAKIEAADALRVVERRFSDAFSKITDIAMPYDDTLKAAGVSQSQFGLFKELVKKEGNVQDAIKAFNEMQGLADWRTLDFLNPTQIKGLKETGSAWDDLLDVVKNPDTTLDDLNRFIDDALGKHQEIASKAVDDVPGFSHNWKSSEDAARMGRAVDEGYIGAADYTKMGQYQEASEQAIDAYKNGIIDQIKALQNPDAALEISLKNQDFMRQAEAAGNAVRKEVDGMWKVIFDTKDKVKAGNTSIMQRTWKELGFEGAPPTDTYDYLSELFSQGRVRRSTKWEEHFRTSIARSEELIKDLEKAGADVNDLQNMFERARALDGKAQEVRSAFYLKNGKGYVGAPPRGTKLGQMDYDSTKKFLETLGWDRGTADGLKNAVNKDLGKSYEKWQDVPWNEALDVVGKRTGQATETAVETTAKAPVPTENVKDFLVQAGVPDDVAEAWKVEQGYKDALNEIKAKMVDTPVGPDYSRLATRLQEATNKAKGAGFVTSDLLKKNKLTRQYLKELTGVMDRRAKKAADELLRQVDQKQVIPVHPAGAEASVPRQYLEAQKGFTETMEYIRSQAAANWGKMSSGADVSRAMAEYGAKYSNRLIDAKAMALKTAEYWRDFTLLGYSTDKTFGNLAASYVMPYSFWYSGTYRNMMERMVTDPQVIAGYAKYKHAMEQEHKFAPDWYKQQAKIANLFGIELENPLFFNLEATLNPLNGLTGADFNDRSKRKDWWTSTLDDIGKFGPSVWAPVQIATAVSMSMKGDEDAALRWAGRLMPQSPAIKGLTSLLFGKQLEVDPNVLLFGGGDSPFDFFGAMDSYERGRVARALGDIQQEDINAIMADQNLTPEQKKQAIAELEAKYTDVAYAQEGPEWERAYELATNLRAPGQITSPLLGVGFKARTTNDLEIDEMYTQMNMLMTMRDGMNKEDYQKGWEQLREQFPFMDTVLLARKGGDLRDGAYAYNVLARIAPGKTDDVFREMKIADLADRFYNNKGSMEGWRQQDKDRFMAAILDIGATFAIPSDATKQEWQAAKNASNAMYDQLKQSYGDDIYEKISEYYAIRDDDYQAGKYFLESNPEIQAYLDDKSAMITNNPLLFKYYGGLQTIESYYESKLRSELQEKHGDDIFKIAAEYSSIDKMDKAARKQWFKDNPDKGKRLTAFWDDYYAEGTQRNVNEAVRRMYEDLPEAEGPVLRGEPETAAQEALIEAVSRNTASPQQLRQQMSPSLQGLVQDYWAGEELSEAAIKQLEYIANRFNMSVDDVLIVAAGQ